MATGSTRGRARSSSRPPRASTKWRQGSQMAAPVLWGLAGKAPARCQGRSGGHNDWHITAPRRGRPSAAAVPAVAPLPLPWHGQAAPPWPPLRRIKAAVVSPSFFPPQWLRTGNMNLSETN